MAEFNSSWKFDKVILASAAPIETYILNLTNHYIPALAARSTLQEY